MDLGRLTFLTIVVTQGRYARNTGNEFTSAYRLNYSRDGLLWKSWRNRLGNAVSGPNTLPPRAGRDPGGGGGGEPEEICDGVIERGQWSQERAGGEDDETRGGLFLPRLWLLLLFTMDGRK